MRVIVEMFLGEVLEGAERGSGSVDKPSIELIDDCRCNACEYIFLIILAEYRECWRIPFLTFAQPVP